ncbi:MAG: hypothetical protein AVDCRST_MAG42-2993, partial [uncultured Chthoniobacterales bacterium]
CYAPPRALLTAGCDSLSQRCCVLGTGIASCRQKRATGGKS